MKTTFACEGLAKALEAKFVAAVESDRPAILAKLGRVQRAALGLFWAVLIALLPTLLRFALTIVLERFGVLTIAQIADMVARHREAVSAQQVHDI